MATFTSLFSWGDEVYLKTDPDQHVRMVVGVYFYPNDMVMYKLAKGSSDSDHYEIELSTEKNPLIQFQS